METNIISGKQINNLIIFENTSDKPITHLRTEDNQLALPIEEALEIWKSKKIFWQFSLTPEVENYYPRSIIFGILPELEHVKCTDYYGSASSICYTSIRKIKLESSTTKFRKEIEPLTKQCIKEIASKVNSKISLLEQILPCELVGAIKTEIERKSKRKLDLEYISILRFAKDDEIADKMIKLIKNGFSIEDIQYEYLKTKVMKKLKANKSIISRLKSAFLK